jgi:hypothetical protein
VRVGHERPAQESAGRTVLMVVCHSPVRQRPTGARRLIPQPHLAKLALIDRVLRQELLADAPYPADVGRAQARPRSSPSAVTTMSLGVADTHDRGIRRMLP